LITRFFPNKKGVSPVIATVILLGVSLVVAVAAACWMGTITATQLEALKDAAIICVTVVVSVFMLFIAGKTPAHPTKT